MTTTTNNFGSGLKGMKPDQILLSQSGPRSFKPNRWAKYMLLIIFLITVISCKRSNQGNSQNDQNSIDSLNYKLTILTDSINSEWNKMISDDDQKIVLMKRLADEVSYTKVYDKKKYDSLLINIEALKKSRYDQTTMAQSSLIDKYDEASSEIVSQVIAFAQQHPRFSEYPIMEELINDILEADNRIIYFRVDYDNIVSEYNKFITTYKELLSQLNNPPKEKPLFQLIE